MGKQKVLLKKKKNYHLVLTIQENYQLHWIFFDFIYICAPG